MKYIPADKLIAEIERRIESWDIRGKNSPAGQGKDTCESRVTELSDLLSFITSLQNEQLVNKELGTLITCDIIEMTVKKAIDKPQDKEKEEELMTRKINYLRSLEENCVQQEQHEQPAVDLEKAVKAYIKDNFTITEEVAQIPEEDRRYSMWEDDMVVFARHFWNKGYNARKEE